VLMKRFHKSARARWTASPPPPPASQTRKSIRPGGGGAAAPADTAWGAPSSSPNLSAAVQVEGYPLRLPATLRYSICYALGGAADPRRVLECVNFFRRAPEEGGGMGEVSSRLRASSKES
jgi:hypothetical protein